MSRINATQSTLGNMLMNLSKWTMLVVATPLVLEGKIPAISLALLVLAAFASFEAAFPLSATLQQAGSIHEAAQRIFRVAAVKRPIDEPATSSSRPDTFDLSLQNIRFRYQPDEPDVLDGVSFTAPQGKCVAIVGANGAGKSPLAHLLLRLWDYQEGHILLGGYELQEFHPQKLSTCVSVVTQNTHLFNTTIRKNLLTARPDASREDLVRAALLHDWIQSLPRGNETQIGEQGHCLSGGERQRLARACALLKDAPILILDEPTAHLSMRSMRKPFSTPSCVWRESTRRCSSPII